MRNVLTFRERRRAVLGYSIGTDLADLLDPHMAAYKGRQ